MAKAKKTKAAKKVYPSKKTLNLCVKEKAQINPIAAIPLVLVVLVLAGLFGKFAVIDRINETNAAKWRISQAEQRVAQLTEATKDYDVVSFEYAKYSTNWMTEDERKRVLRTDMIALINKEFMTETSSVRSIRMSGNRISLELNNASLESTAGLVDQLSAREDVSAIAVNSAKSDNGKENIVSVVVTMKYVEKEGEKK